VWPEESLASVLVVSSLCDFEELNLGCLLRWAADSSKILQFILHQRGAIFGRALGKLRWPNRHNGPVVHANHIAPVNLDSRASASKGLERRLNRILATYT
jgi:hypothetical protein